jgi:hypothetical protein
MRKLEKSLNRLRKAIAKHDEVCGQLIDTVIQMGGQTHSKLSDIEWCSCGQPYIPEDKNDKFCSGCYWYRRWSMRDKLLSM